VGLVFTNTTGDPLQEHTFASAWAFARSRVDAPDWATPKTTLDIYGHLFDDEEDKTRTAIDAEFGALTACRRPEARFSLEGHLDVEDAGQALVPP
jgi:hypothetical protein